MSKNLKEVTERALLMAGDAGGEGSEDGSWTGQKHSGFLPQCPFDSLLCDLEAEILSDKLILSQHLKKKEFENVEDAYLGFLCVGTLLIIDVLKN